MKVSHIHSVLEKLRSLYASAGAKSQAGDCQKLLDALADFRTEELELFVGRVSASLNRSTAPPLGPDDYAKMLLSAGTDEAAFNIALSTAVDNRRITKAALDAIANRYLNTPSGGSHVYKFKTRQRTVEAIRSKFIERAQLEGKGNIIDKLMGSAGEKHS
jgi:hypothetical protein